MKKTNHLSEFLNRIEERTGQRPKIGWEESGPKDTIITRHAMLIVAGTTVYFQEYGDDGWEAYVPATKQNSISATIEAVVSRINHNV